MQINSKVYFMNKMCDQFLWLPFYPNYPIYPNYPNY